MCVCVLGGSKPAWAVSDKHSTGCTDRDRAAQDSKSHVPLLPKPLLWALQESCAGKRQSLTFLLFNMDSGRRLLFLQRDGFLRDSRTCYKMGEAQEREVRL